MGYTTSWKKYETPEMRSTITIRGLKACISEMPAALMAVSSELSPRLPKTISELSRMASGKA